MEEIIYYYSGGGNNRELAAVLQKRLGCEAVPIDPAAPRSFIGCLLSMLLKLPRKAGPSLTAEQRYGLAIVCFPIWGGKMPPAVRSFIRQNRDKFMHIAVASASHQGDATGSMLLDFISTAGGRPLAVLDISLKSPGGAIAVKNDADNVDRTASIVARAAPEIDLFISAIGTTR